MIAWRPKMFVYFIGAGDDGPIKIGCSENPASRLPVLMSWSPYPLTLLAFVDGGHPLELTLHERFNKQHSHGEWFLPSDELCGLVDEAKMTGALNSVEINPDWIWIEANRRKYKSVVADLLAIVGCSAHEMAKSCGCSTQTIWKWHREGVSIGGLKAALEFFRKRGLHITARDLFTRTAMEAADASKNF